MAVAKHLYVVIPGIGGSDLVDPAGKPDDRRVWFGGRTSLLAAFAEPDRLDVSRPLVPVGLLGDFSILPLLKHIDGYDKLWQAITAAFPTAPTDLGNPADERLDATVVAFPYDFRLGVAHAAERLAANLARRVERLGEATTVVFVAHSMGGLVARHWVAHHDNVHRCRGVITLGTPFRGAPKALDVLVNGLYWGSRLVQRRELSRVVQAWPGLHDLVPIDDRVTLPSGDRGGPWECDGLPGLADLKTARDTHVATRAWWADTDSQRRPALYVFAGHSHGTLASARWDGVRLRVAKDPLDGERGGDGTVPEFAAIPPELWGGPAKQSLRPCGDSHGTISFTTGLRACLELVNSGTPPPTRGDGDEASFAGFDLDPVVEPGDTIVASVLLDGSPLTDTPDKPTEPTDVDADTAMRSAHDDDLFVDGVRVAGVLVDGRDRVELAVDVEPDGTFSVALPAGREGTVELTARVDRGGRRFSVVDRVSVIGVEG